MKAYTNNQAKMVLVVGKEFASYEFYGGRITMETAFQKARKNVQRGATDCYTHVPHADTDDDNPQT